jgi:hypothetical protein
VIYEPLPQSLHYNSNRGYDYFLAGRAYDELGVQMRGSGDLNGDGRMDYLLWGSTSVYQTGVKRMVVYGVTTHIDGVSRRAATAEREMDFSLWADGFAEVDTWGPPAILGDVNGDGCDDFALGNPTYNGGQGRVHLFLGCVAYGNNAVSNMASHLAAGIIAAPGGVGDRFGEALISK